MSASVILQSQSEGITTITLNRPDIGNRISDEMAAQLAKVIESASEESQAIVLRGAGENFCLGREVFGKRELGQEAYEHREEIGPIFDLYSALRHSKVPTVALVEGHATGFGCALAAVADITLASDSAKFCFPEMGHQIMPTMAMSSLIDRIGLKALMYLIYSTDEIDAERAQNIGLISKVVPSDHFEENARTLLSNLGSAPLAAIKAVKEYALAAQTMSTEAATTFAKSLHSVVNTSSRMSNKKTE